MEFSSRGHILTGIKVLSQHDIPVTWDNLHANHYISTWEGDEHTFAATLAELLADASIVLNGEVYYLTEHGTRQAQAFAGQWFGEWMCAAAQSPAYRKYCQRVLGADRCQFDMLTDLQLARLLAVLNVSEGQHVLDLGCGTGSLSETIADHTGAIVTGLDFSPNAIAFAQARTRDKRERLSYQVMDMDDLHLPPKSFDAIVSIDSLYYVNDMYRTIAAAIPSMRDGGQMGIFYSNWLPENPTPELLGPAATLPGNVLAACGLSYQAWDFTDDEKQLWETSLAVANELKDEFAAEGNLAVYNGRIEESTTAVQMARAGRIVRYLYHVRL